MGKSGCKLTGAMIHRGRGDSPFILHLLFDLQRFICSLHHSSRLQPRSAGATNLTLPPQELLWLPHAWSKVPSDNLGEMQRFFFFSSIQVISQRDRCLLSSQQLLLLCVDCVLILYQSDEILTSLGGQGGKTLREDNGQ